MNAEDFLTKNTLPSTWDGDVLLSSPSKQCTQCYRTSLWAVLNSHEDARRAQQPREEQHAAQEPWWSTSPLSPFHPNPHWHILTSVSLGRLLTVFMRHCREGYRHPPRATSSTTRSQSSSARYCLCSHLFKIPTGY